MTIDPVATSIELYANLLQSAYLQASRSTRAAVSPSSSGQRDVNETTQATVNYALSVSVQSRQQQQAADATELAQNIVPFLQPTQVGDPVVASQARLQLQRVRQGTIEPITLALEGTEATIDPLLTLAGVVYSKASADSIGGDTVGTNFSAVA